MTDRPTHVLDPVCGMSVEVLAAEAAGLTAEHDGRVFAFCRSGCRRAFLEEPATYAAEAAAAAVPAAAAGTTGRPTPVIDEGIRRWYEACACCLGETYPEIKAQLDAERATASSGA